MEILFDEMTHNYYETIFYPFSGADFSIIKHIHQSIPSEKLNIKNFIFCDGCLNEDPYDLRLEHLENQLGVQGFEIIQKSNYLLDQQDYLTIKNDVLNSTKDNKNYTKYLSSTNNEGITYYKLKSIEKEKPDYHVNLFFIKSETITALKFLLKNWEENLPHFGLIIQTPGNQSDEFLKSTVFKDYNPSFIIIENVSINEQFKKSHFQNYILDNSDNIFLENMKLIWKNEEEKKRITMVSKGKKLIL